MNQYLMILLKINLKINIIIIRINFNINNIKIIKIMHQVINKIQLQALIKESVVKFQ